MTVPKLPAFFDMICTKEDFRFSTDFYLYLDQQFQVLNDMVSLLNGITTTVITGTNKNNTTVTINGLTPPSLTTGEITALVDAIPRTVPIGTIWYNSTMDKLQVLVLLASVPTVQTITSA